MFASFILFLQTSNGQVEAKVQCFYRRRDLSSALAIQAEKHLCKFGELDMFWFTSCQHLLSGKCSHTFHVSWFTNLYALFLAILSIKWISNWTKIIWITDIISLFIRNWSVCYCELSCLMKIVMKTFVNTSWSSHRFYSLQKEASINFQVYKVTMVLANIIFHLEYLIFPQGFVIVFLTLVLLVVFGFCNSCVKLNISIFLFLSSNITARFQLNEYIFLFSWNILCQWPISMINLLSLNY